MVNKIIFLDIDGVLVSGQYLKTLATDPDQLDPIAVDRLNRLTNATGAQLVITSTRRIGYLDDPDGLVMLGDRFIQNGVKAPVIGMTPDHVVNCDSNVDGHRGTEITAWLVGTDDLVFIVLDDQVVLGYDGQQIQTDFATGLLDSHVDQAINLLGKK